jgi:acetyl/propionyl-CoA carboxylase alpha subunit
MPAGPGVRVDSAIEPGERVPPEYDNLIAKIMAHASSRAAAIKRLRRALSETEIGGMQTTLPFHRYVVDEPSFAAAELSTDWVPEHWDGPREFERAANAALVAAGLLALEEPSPPVSSAGREGVQASAWREAGLERAVDRWPR